MRWYRREYAILGCILVVRLLAALWFASQTPLWEQIDEINHYQYARFLAFERRLPTDVDQPPVPNGLDIFLQFNQPPLYYALLSPAILAFDSDEPLPVFANPPPSCNVPFRQRYVHSANEHFPFEGVGRAAWGARLITILMGVLATFCVWLTARVLFPEMRRLGLLAAGLFALIPATVELSTWINNDAPLMLFGAIILYWLAKLWQGDQRWWIWVGLFVGVGLCVGTKLNGLAVMPMIGVVIFWRLVWRADSLRIVRLLIFISAVTFSVGGFIGLNYWQCGRAVCRIHRDTFVFNSYEALRDSVINEKFVDASRLLVWTGTTPWISDLYPPAIWEIQLGVVIFGIGLVGAFVALWSNRALRGRLLILIGVILSAMALAYLRVWWLQVSYMPMRYMAVALPAFVILLGVGFIRLSSWFSRWSMLLPLGGFGAMVILIPLLHYRPLLVEADRFDRLPLSANLIENYQFESGVQVVGYSLDPTSDGRLGLRLYMTTTEEHDEPLYAMVYGLDEDRIPVRQCGIIAGGSLWPTTAWEIGELVAQVFYFDMSAETVYFSVELYYLQNRYHLVNQYDVSRPDRRISGGLITIQAEQ